LCDRDFPGGRLSFSPIFRGDAPYQFVEKVHPWTFSSPQAENEFPSCSQNQGLVKMSLILVALPWAPQAVFQQPAIAGRQDTMSRRRVPYFLDGQNASKNPGFHASLRGVPLLDLPK
jgi:hypothetical protein